MTDSINVLAKELAKAIPSKSKTSPYDTQAVVKRIDGDIAWVHIPGGVDETPVQLTTNAKKGDIVQVRVSGGRAWLYGNATSPPTDDTVAVKAVTIANVAETKSEIAQDTASDAVRSADIAATAASNAEASAQQAEDSAEQANDYALQALSSATEASSYAQQALTSANNASNSATKAYNSASTALNQLSVVEDVVGVLEMLSTHGTYDLTQDSAVQEGKWYFIEVDTNVYEVVTNPVGNPSENGWYELVNIDNAVRNYVASHLALTDDGLFLQIDGSDYRLQLSGDGVSIWSSSGIIASYGLDAVIGDPNGFHIKITSDRLSFYTSADDEVAYISDSQLYITQSVVLENMDIGDKTNGRWSWAVHLVSVNNIAKNNLYLKWLG